MDQPSPSVRELARRLLAASRSDSGSHEHEAMQVCGTLRTSLTRFAGSDGFTSLISRALALASAEVPALQSVKIGAGGRLEGFQELAADPEVNATGGEAAIAITAHLLALLVTFIGEPLTRNLLREAWPEMSLEE